MRRSMAYKPMVIDVGQTNNTEAYYGDNEQGCKKTEENQGLQGSTGGIVLCEAKKAPAQARRHNIDASYGNLQWKDQKKPNSHY